MAGFCEHGESISFPGYEVPLVVFARTADPVEFKLTPWHAVGRPIKMSAETADAQPSTRVADAQRINCTIGPSDPRLGPSACQRSWRAEFAAIVG